MVLLVEDSLAGGEEGFDVGCVQEFALLDVVVDGGVLFYGFLELFAVDVVLVSFLFLVDEFVGEEDGLGLSLSQSMVTRFLNSTTIIPLSVRFPNRIPILTFDNDWM